MITKADSADQSKQGVTFKGNTVLKEHATMESAMREVSVAKAFARNGQSHVFVPDYGKPVRLNGRVFLPYSRIHGTTLMNCTSISTMKKAVEQLALFHELFAPRSNRSNPVSLYRDAMPANIIDDTYRLWQIDFTSSHRLVHCLDDLALLLHPELSRIPSAELPRLVVAYRQARSRLGRALSLNRFNVSSIVGPMEWPNAKVYQEILDQMSAAGVSSHRLYESMGSIDFHHLRADDFQVFLEFRRVRIQYYRRVLWKGRV